MKKSIIKVQAYKGKFGVKKNKWLIFILVAIAQFMVVLDTSITNVAIPSIKSDLRFSNSAIQWVLTAYIMTFGGFLLLGGRLADLLGRRKTLLIGMIAFTCFSLFVGLSQSATFLIILRALQGLSAALMSPSALSIVLITFNDKDPDRNRALAYWTLVATGGAAVGLLVGGILTQLLGWRWNFFINVPIGIIIAIAIYKYVPVYEKGEKRKTLDLPGAVLVTSSLMALVFAFSEAPNWGWLNHTVVSVFILSIILMVAFVVNEVESSNPLVPLSIFKIRNVTTANLMFGPVYSSMLGLYLILTLYMQDILKYSPITTGVSYLPIPIVWGLMAEQTPKLVSKYGFKPFLILGPLFVSSGMIWISNLPARGSYIVNILPAMILAAIGMGMLVMPIIATATSGVSSDKSGLASGLINTSQFMGGALGLAIISGVAATVTAGAIRLGHSAALTRGFDRAMLLAAAFALSASIIAAIGVKNPKKQTTHIK